jgi:hypothetical protein
MEGGESTGSGAGRGADDGTGAAAVYSARPLGNDDAGICGGLAEVLRECVFANLSEPLDVSPATPLLSLGEWI